MPRWLGWVDDDESVLLSGEIAQRMMMWLMLIIVCLKILVAVSATSPTIASLSGDHSTKWLRRLFYLAKAVKRRVVDRLYILLLALYVERGVFTWDQCKKYEYWRPTDRPTSGPIHTYWKISNGHNSATRRGRRPIDFVFGSMVGFSVTADRTAPFPVVSGCHFVNSHDHIFETHYPIHFMYVHRPYFTLGLYNDCWRLW